MTHSSEDATGTVEGIGQQDHSFTSEYRIFGPPGCGKTTSLARQIRRAVERFGPDSVLVTSFSRTAAAELVGRNLPIHRDHIGTLHSHCYHLLGRPQIAEANVEDWNRNHPHLQITPVKKQGKLDGEEGVEENDDQTKDGDHWLQELSRYRGMMIAPEGWPPNLRDFEKHWTAYKRAIGAMDFCDLIETALNEIPFAPKRPSVIFVDEAQDLNRMQLTLIRKWGKRADYFIVCGDEDQLLYSWCGCTVDAFLEPHLPKDHKIILKQSYRVPRAIHAAANRLIRQVTRRQEKEYFPRPTDGLLQQASGTYRVPEYWILKKMLEHLEAGRTVMFLTSCSYMLHPVVAVLRKNGIPFHNPYRRSNGYWNPLRSSTRGATVNRILALLAAHPDFGEHRRDWDYGDLLLWSEWLTNQGILKPGAKTKLQAADAAQTVTVGTLDEVFEPGALESLLTAFQGDYRALLDWWRRRVLTTVHDRVQFPVDVAMTGGPHALLDKPRVIVGTIHSVKGGEADVVFLFPDLSRAADAQYQRFGPPRDAVIRTFYVGMTRARQALYLCEKASTLAVNL
jgi:DNA helicase-2/ATP-dependent DNA helicase PcrA